MANRPANIHDAFFKKVLANPETAGTFLREQSFRHALVDLARIEDGAFGERLSFTVAA